MASIKRDDVKQSWETDTEFPLVCETCLGDNPYVRMTVEAHGKKCQICENPFTVFAWQAGSKGRLKRVEICRSCAKAKNVCQVCIYDLQYGLPVKVRDRVLRESGSSAAVTAVPQSHANRAWFTAQQQRALATSATGDGTSALTHATLQGMARMEPRYERNLPKLCSFFAKGECDRGDTCPFRHEMPRDRNDPMAKQNTKDRFYGTNDPVANKIIGRKRRQEQEQQNRMEEEDFDKARATVYLRFQGDPPYPNLTEMNIRDVFYAYGEIVSVRPHPDKGQAFVEYTQPEAAELAIASIHRKELLGRLISVFWARAPKRGDAAPPRNGDAPEHPAAASLAAPVRPVPPPGVSSKSLPEGLFNAVKPPPEVAAMAASVSRQSVGGGEAPRGGPIRKVGAEAAKRVVGVASKPYYPSTDPGRLGSKAEPPSI